MARTALLKGEVPVQRSELEALRRKAAELEDYREAARAPQVEKLRRRAMTYQRAGFTPTSATGAWARGIMDYESAFGEALVERMRGRD